MKNLTSITNIPKNSKSKYEEIENYNYGITNQLLEKYKPSLDLRVIQGNQKVTKSKKIA